LSALAADERHRILKRANDGRTAAKAKGTRFGRKPKLTAHQQAEALKRLAVLDRRRRRRRLDRQKAVPGRMRANQDSPTSCRDLWQVRAV